MSEGNQFVRFVLESLLKLGLCNSLPKVCPNLVDICTIGPETLKGTASELNVEYYFYSGPHQSAKLSPKYPLFRSKTLSPGSTRLAETFMQKRLSRTS